MLSRTDTLILLQQQLLIAADLCAELAEESVDRESVRADTMSAGLLTDKQSDDKNFIHG